MSALDRFNCIWTPCIGENVTAEREPDNMDKCAVCVKKDKNIVCHLKKGKSGRFAKTFFYFLKADLVMPRSLGKGPTLVMEKDYRCLAS